MVLDSIVNGEFIFKNRDGNKVKVPVASQDAPDEFYFVHIKVKQAAIEEIRLAIPWVLMLQKSCKLLIEQCHECGIIYDGKKKKCLERITKGTFHDDTLRSLMKILSPHSVLKDTVSRVRIELKFTF